MPLASVVVPRTAMPSNSMPPRRRRPGAGTPFVGRVRELGLLRDALTAALAGRGWLVLLAGEAGIGKTRLAEQVAQDAESRGARVLIGRCYEGEGAPAYWPWVAALRALGAAPEPARVRAWLRGNAGVIAQVVPDLIEDSDAPAPHALDGDAARFRFFDAVVTTLARAAADRPLVVLLDDLHWADAGSLRLLHFAVGQLGQAPVLLIGTHRDVEMRFGAESAVRAELARVGERIALGGLDATEVAGVVRALLPGDVPARASERIHALTEGNPFFVDALVRVLARSGDVARHLDALAIPDGVHDVIRARLRPLDPGALRLVTVAALVGREFAVAFTARVADVDIAAATSAFDAAERLGLVGPVGDDGRRRFAHALIMETLALDTPALERARLHRRIAEAMAPLVPAGTVSFDEVASHYLAAVPAGAADEAVTYAVRAAEGAIARLGYEDAVRYYRRALHVLDVAAASDAARRATLLLALAHAERRAGDAANARAVFARVATVAREAGLVDVLARAALGYGAGLGAFWDEGAGNLDAERAALVREALDALGDGLPALRAQLLAHLAATLFWSPLREHRAQVLALGREANETAARSGDPAAILAVAVSTEWTCWGTDTADGRLRRADDILRRATELHQPEAALRAHMYVTVCRLERGEIVEADRTVERFAAYARELRQDPQLWYATLYRGMRGLMSGDFAETARAIEEGSLSPAATRLAFEAQRTILLRERGRTRETIEPTRALVRSLPGLPVWRCALASALAECGDLDGARVELEQLGVEDFAGLHRDFLWLYGMSHLARACAAVGDVARARVLYDMLLPYADWFAVAGQGTLCDGSIARHLGLLATTLERWEDAVRHFDAALAAHERIGANALVTATQADYATMLRRRGKSGDERRARTLADAALAGARRLGQSGLAARIEATLGVAPVAAPGPATEDVCTLRSDGDDWVVTHAGRAFALKGTIGVTYLVTLLRHPGREFHALDLVTSGESSPASVGDAGEMLDDRARAAYRRRLTELGAELEEARAFNDLGRAERVGAEIESLTDELSRAVGFGGRTRRAGSDAERARLNVTRALKRAIETVAARDAALGSDLERGIRTGHFCSYTPDPRAPVRWDV